jgi:ferric-dicitrate binding protein FerR (iron transport regulator)
MSEHDPIGALLKATGRRPAVPAERTDRVRDAARAQWRGEIGRRARRRRIVWVGSLAATVAAVAVLGGLRSLRSPIADEPPGLRVERVVSSASARRGSIPIVDRSAALHEGSIDALGSDVTTGAGARVALRSPSGFSIRLDGGTRLRLLADGVFALERGAVYVDSHGEGRSIRIGTAVGTIEDQGTQFEARLDGRTLFVRVREGAVTLTASSGRVAARAGEALRLDPSGRIHRTDDAPAGVAWGWAEAIAPMMDIEGESLSAFLQWDARERGVRLVFSEAGLADRASTIILSGSIAGMTLDEATTSVLATSGLVHRWDGDTLVVGAGPSTPRSP